MPSTLVSHSEDENALLAATTELASKIEKHLMDTKFLMGEHPTLADVIVAIALAHVGTEPAAQTKTWIASVLNRVYDFVQYTPIAGWNELGLSSANNCWKKWLSGFGSSLAAATPVVATTNAEVTEPKASDSASAMGDNAIVTKLREHGMDFVLYDHTLSTTAEELVANVPLPASETHTKNLFLRDKKHGLFLITVHPDTKVDTKQLGKLLGLPGKTNLRMADAETLEAALHVKPGCVGPLDMAIATEDVKLAIEERLFTYDLVHSHPLANDKSIKMKPDAYQAFFAKCGVEPIYLDFSSVIPEASQGGGPKKSGGSDKQVTKEPKTNKKATKKGETLLALQWKKTENFPMWYSDVIVLSEMISYYDISGCYILRPWSYKMWELIQEWFNVKIQAMGVENSYFPMFVSQERLEREKDHVEGFAPEVAWVTKSGDGELAKPIAVRPTSETIMYPAYADWIRSHRDLPLKLNQWSNVVRWEFKYPTPFLRTREFLWQEGHTAHATFEDADETVMAALDLYRGVYEELLAVPVVPGYKTEKEKFAGGFRTTTVEAYIAGSGRAIQGATSHNLGQNFGKMFDIKFQDENGQSQIVWQTSWGLTTRTIGVMVMVHGDDVGLVIPPRIAPVQVVIVPIYSKNLPPETADPYCQMILSNLEAAGIRAKFDDRTAYNPGWKYNHWEQKGVPIRVEVGPRDIESSQARVVVRHDGSKDDMSVEGMGAAFLLKLEEIQKAMFEKAKTARDSHIVTVTEWKDFVPNLEKNNLVLVPWCGGEHQDWEEKVKEMSREESLKARGEEAEDEKTATSVAAKTLCIPFDQPPLPEGTKCIASGMDATCWVLWGRSY